MGLLKSVLNAGRTTMRDQYKEYFYCDKMESDVLVKKGCIQNNSGNSQNRGTEGIISKGSVIVVNEGQCMIIVDNGKIVDFCAEAGEFIYDDSIEPSLFAGNFGKNLIESFKTFGKRITFAGDTGRKQCVYYINLLPIFGGKFGTQSPVDYLDSGVTLRLAMRGTYKLKVTNPILFYSSLAGNVISEFRLSDVQVGQFKSDVISSLSPALQKLSIENIPYSLILGLGDTKLTDAVKEKLYNEWESQYGLTVATLNVEVVTPTDDDNYAAYKQLQIKRQHADYAVAQGGNSMAMQQRMAGTYVDSDGQIQSIANQNSGSAGNAMDMFGMAMMGNMMNNGMFGNMNGNNSNNQSNNSQVNQQYNTQNQQESPTVVTNNNQDIEQSNGWICGCGETNNQGKFCQECGNPKPPEALLYKCDKCGWVPEDPKNPPRFCPECGESFNDEDTK